MRENERVSESDQERGMVLTTLKHLEKEVGEIKTMLDAKCVTRDEFAPVKNLVYGGVGIALATILGAAITLLFHK